MTINDYYRRLKDLARKDIRNTNDEAALSFDPTSWVDHVFDGAALRPVEIASDRTPSFADRTSGVRVVLPVVPSKTLETIIEYQLESQVSTFAYGIRNIRYDAAAGELWIEASEEPGDVKSRFDFLRDQVSRWNADIAAWNTPLKAFIEGEVTNRVEATRQRRGRLAEIERVVGIKLVLRSDPRTIVPVALSVRKEVRPLIEKSAGGQRLVLDRETFDRIITLVNNQGRQFERTPAVFQRLVEEELRDILLSSLNAVFGNAASGEAFSVLGKTDIHLSLPGGDLFIAECKPWSGVSSLAEVVAQLLDRLTWHESYGAVLVFSKNKDFGNVLAEIEAGLPTLPNFEGGLRKIDPQQFAARFRLPADATKQVEVHVLAYSLFTSRNPGRSTARKSDAS